MSIMLLNISLTHYIETHILIPRKHNCGKLTRVDVGMIWLFSNKVETKWARVVIHHLMDTKINNMWLPYGDLITKY